MEILGYDIHNMSSKIKIFISPKSVGDIFIMNADGYSTLPIDMSSNFDIIHDKENICSHTFVPINVNSDKDIRAIIDYLGDKSKLCWFLVINLFHAYEQDLTIFSHHSELLKLRQINKKIIIADTYYESETYNDNRLFYDFLWNRHKLYYTEYDKLLLNHRVWTYGLNKSTFRLGGIKKHSNLNFPMKKFLCPIRNVYEDNFAAPHMGRALCRNLFMLHMDSVDAYYSNWTSFPRRLLQCESNEINESNFTGWCPIDNRYYSASYISAYVETLAYKSHARTITEKTFDPLIKGHFILPYGYPGLVSDIKSIYGFKLPDWIDYSYDSVEDDLIRFNMFIKEFYRLKSFPISYFQKKFTEDIDILQENRKIFFTRPYDDLAIKLRNKVLTKLRWD